MDALLLVCRLVFRVCFCGVSFNLIPDAHSPPCLRDHLFFASGEIHASRRPPMSCQPSIFLRASPNRRMMHASPSVLVVACFSIHLVSKHGRCIFVCDASLLAQSLRIRFDITLSCSFVEVIAFCAPSIL